MEIPLAMPQMCAALHLLDAGEPKHTSSQSGLKTICRGLVAHTMQLATLYTNDICPGLQSLL